MVAVVSGSGLGLFNSSASSLGGDSAGNAQVGRGRDRVYVNSTTGNLVVQSVDETLSALGLDFAAIRTYNSQGLTDEDNGDQWRLGVHMRLSAVTGGTGVNTAGSRLTKTFGDGAEVVYTYNTTRSRYESSDGDGANDFLFWNGSTWTWTDGSSRVTEEYALIGGVQRIRFSRDADLNTVTYNYTGTLLTSLNMANPGAIANNAQTVTFTYSGTNLMSIGVTSWNGTILASQTLTSYTYDTSQRLETVTVDLTPTITNDSVIYRTTYTYDGASKRIASITQTDGSSVAFVYQNINGDYRLQRVTDAEGRITTFAYSEVYSTGGTQQTAIANAGQISNQDTTSTPYPIILGTLVRGEQQPTTTPYPLNTQPLTTPPGGAAWGTAATLEAEPSGSTASAPQVAFDSNGNGFAIWTVTTGTTRTLKASRYTRATNSWQTTPATLYTSTTNLPQASLAVDAGGNAIVAWIAGNAIMAIRYTTNWGLSEIVASSAATMKPTVAMNGSFAAIIYGEGSPANNAIVMRSSGSGWTRSVVDSQTTALSELGVAVDNQGNVVATFSQIEGAATANCVWTNLYRVSTGTWSGPVTRDPLSPVATTPQFGFDSNGNGFMTFAQSGDAYFVRYTRSNNTWGTATALDSMSGSVTQTSLSVDPSGNAVVAWVQSSGGANSAFAKVYNATTSTWGPVTTLESLTTAVTAGSLKTSIRGSAATVAWLQNDGTRENVYASTYNGTSWSSTPTVIETSTQTPSSPSIAVDSAGNASAVWIQSNGTAPSVYFNRFTVGAGGAPYYLVPAGATWRSIANTLYGIDSDAAGTALQNALPGQSIAAGSQIPEANLPKPLPVTTFTTVPDYYLVPGSPATPTWRSIAAVVYGIDSAAAGTALQNRMAALFPGQYQTLSAGLHISGLPSTLDVSTTVTLPYYYHVVQSSSWATTVQTIYNTSDQGLIDAVKAYSGVSTATLTVGSRLQVQQNQPYTVGGATGPVVYQRTTVQDSLGLITTYLKDTQGRLLSVQTPAIGGTPIETRYTYDATTGNVATITEDPTGLNRITNFTYDPATGLLLSTRDTLGNYVSLTYNTHNQLDTQTSYVGRATSGTPTGTSMVSRYVYDGSGATSENHLRFVISADGRVVEHVYNGNGERTTTYKYAASTYSGAYTEAALSSWATGQRANALELTEYSYDFRSNLSTVRTWTATNASGAGSGTSSTTRFIYDQRGQLVTTVEARGEATATPTTDYLTNYTYDGLGRAMLTTSWVSSTETARPIKSIVYDDANRRTITTLANGLTRTETFNRDGELITVALGPVAVGQTAYTYDAGGRERVVTDPTGVKTYCFYDDVGRKIGYVDGDGSLTELVYNRAHQVIKTIRYATRLSSTTLTSLAGTGWNTIPFATLRSEANTASGSNQMARNVYDASGRRVYTLELIDSVNQYNAVTKNTYDGAGRLIEQIQFVNTQTLASSIDEVLSSAITVSESATGNRRARYFYNADGQLTGTLDAAGYLKENVYDAGGRLITQIGYANPSDSSRWLTGTLDTLRPGPSGGTAQLDPARDIRTRFFYDAQGRKLGELDGERYLTEVIYDVAGKVTQTIRYDVQLTDTSGTTTFDALKGGTTGATTHSTSYTYNGLGQVLTETNFENTQTLYSYDVAGNLISTTRANGAGAEARTTQARYDILGRVTQQLTAEGSAALAALGGSPTQAQIDAVWNKYSITYGYDNANRRISASVRPNDSQTNTTYYYYDEDGRVRFELDALGRVTENRYNALGQLVDRLAYWRPVSITTPTGGLLNATLIGQLTQYESSNIHEKTTYAYSLRGAISSTLTAAGATSASTYNVFGQLETGQVGGLAAISYTYDARGLQKLTRRGAVTLEDRSFDAFGRLTSFIDRGNTRTITYDRLGREVTTSESGDANARLTTYDGFSRVVTVRDKLLNATSYSYNDTTRTVTVTTPETIVVSTAHNRHGETVTVTANGNTTSYVYDLNGNLTSSSDSLGSLESRAYDRTGRQVEARDARGTITTLSYDAVNRLLTRIVDTAAGGLALATTYSYDTLARVMTVTEPGNRVTRTEYDRDGRVAAIIIDPSGAKPFRTEYQYDTANNTTLVIEGVGAAAGTPIRRTQYLYDTAGRRTDEYLDPASQGGTLNIRTQYVYDDKDNVVRKIDARSNSTWYVYDAQKRLLQTIDALGGVTQVTYDSEDRVIETRRYLTAVATGGLGNAPTLQAITKQLSDRVTRSVYDKDGREKYTIDTLRATGSPGAVTEFAVVTERSFDAGGNVTRARVYHAEITVPATVDASSVLTALNNAGNNTSTLTFDDHVERMLYDARGRLEIKIDGSGAVTQYEYDANGNVTKRTEYAATVPVDGVVRLWHTNGTNNSIQRYVGNFAAGDVVTATVRFKATNGTTGLMFLGDAGGPNPYDNYVQTLLTNGNDGWQTLTLNLTLSHADDVWVYVYSDYSGSNNSVSVLFDDVKVTSTARGTVLADKFDTFSGEWGMSTLAQLEMATLGDLGSDAAIRGLVSSLSTNSPQDRVTRFWYDTLDRERIALDAEGYASETRYNDSARTEEIFAYFNPPGVAANATLDQVRAAITANALDRYERSEFDVVGRVVRRVDGLGQAESFEYDAVGNKTRFTNRKNNVWNYVYDANHRLTEERSPAVGLITISESTPDGGNLTAAGSVVEVVTRIEYNALGDVTRRIEGFGRPEQRETNYGYDELGRQTSVSSPNVRVYTPTDESTSTLANMRQESIVTLTSTTRYDVFGNAVVGQDAAGNYSHKAYDQLGRVVYDVDSLRNVTFYKYDTFGNVTRLIRHASSVSLTSPTTLNESATWTAADIASHLSTGAQDREINTEYDRLNRAVRVLQPAAFSFSATPGASYGGTPTTGVGAETRNEFNAFGEVIRQRQLFQSPSDWADTYFYYDKLGHRTATVDALGYLTRETFDAAGNVTRHYEAAKPIAAGNWNPYSYLNPPETTPTSSLDDAAGYDRDFRYVYDRLDRRTEQRQLHVEATSISGQSPSRSFIEQVTSYDYDAVGNQIRVTDHAGAQTYTYYDVLGRVMAVAAPTRDLDGSGDPSALSNLTPLTLYFRNAHGDLVGEYKYATNPASVGLTSYAVGSTNAADEYTRILVDNYGRVRRTQDSNDANRFASYDRVGNVVKEWQPVVNASGVTETLVTIHRYDVLGRETAIIEPQKVGSGATTIFTQTRYNAFGEIIEQGTNGSLVADGTALQEYFEYDLAGRMWKTNSRGGVNTIILHDLMGNTSAEIRSMTVDLRSMGASSAHDLSLSQRMRTETVYDKLGRVTEQREPTFEATSGVDPINATFAINYYDGPANPLAIYQRQFYDYGEGPQEYYIVNPTATLAQDGGWYLNASGYYEQDPNHQIVSRLRIVWDAPLEAGVNATFQYRPSSSTNESDWAGVSAGALPNNKLGVNVQSLLNQDYAYRVRYQRSVQTSYYAEATGSFRVNGTVGSASLSVTPIGADPASEVGSLPASTTGGIILWAAPAGSLVGLTAAFRVFSAATGWQTQPASLSGPNFSADLRDELQQPGTYTYEVIYQRDGVTVATHTGSLYTPGLTYTHQVLPYNVILTQGTTFNESVGTITARNSGQVGGRWITSQVSAGGNEPNELWSGSNSVELNWADIGPGTLSVQLDYMSAEWDGWDRRGFQEVHHAPQLVSGRVFTTGITRTGASFSFGAIQINNRWVGGITSIQAVRVYRDGVLVYQTTNPTLNYGRSLDWAAPTSLYYFPDATFEYAPQGTSSYSALAVTKGETRWGVNLNGVLSGSYDYRIRYRLGGRIFSEQTGRLTIATDGTTSTTLLTNPAYPATIITPTLTGDLLSWNQPTDGAATSVVLSYEAFGPTYNYTNSVTLQPTSGSNYSYRFSEFFPTGGGIVGVNFTIEYLHSGETMGYARGKGVFAMDITNQPVQPRIDIQSQAPVFPSGLQAIPAATGVESRFITWSPQAQAGATPRFRYRLPNSSVWTELPVQPVSGGYRVDLLAVPNETYRYEITYTMGTPGVQNPYARGEGQFTVNRINGSISNFTISPVAPGSPTLVQRTPRQLQSLDRWGNVVAHTDAANQTTNYRFTALGDLAQITQPQVEIVSTTGNNVVVTAPSAASAPKTFNYYDALGRLVGTRDANGKVNSLTLNLAGQAIREWHADGGYKSFVLDAFGNQLTVYDELGWRTWHTYDRANRLTRTQREVASGDSISRDFVYDEAGRRIRETSGDTSGIGDGDGGQESTRYFYDLVGNLIRSRSELGYETNFGYDVKGRKTSEVNAIGGSMGWGYDYFRLTSHTNLAGTSYSYGYNLAGLQTTQTGGGQNLTNSYDWAGHITVINDQGVHRVTTFSYDAAGRRAREKTVIDDLLHQDTLTGYDAIGRISTLTDLRYDLKYRYDAQGNRTHISATYYDHQQAARAQNLWYTYDAMNRVLISQGVNNFNSVSVDSTGGVRLTYDLAGQRKTATQWGKQYIKDVITHRWIPQIEDYHTTDNWELVNASYTDTYTYDGAGRLTFIDRTGEEVERFADQFGNVGSSTTTPRTYRISERTYDGASRMTREIERAVEGTKLRSRTHESVYDDDGRLSNQTNSNGLNGSGLPRLETTISFNTDGAGVTRSYAVNVWNPADNTVKYTSTYTNSFRLADTYLDAGQSVTSSGSGAPLSGSTVRSYNVNHELISFVDNRDHRKNRYFANDASGRALTVIQPITTETGATPNLTTAFQNALLRRDNSTRSQHFFFAQGQYIGSFGQLVDDSGQFKANFDVNYQPISASNPTSAPAEVIAQTGDTSRTIAARVFGDPNLWYLIADENGFTGPDQVIQEGTSVRIPNEVVSLSNDANTFKPFNPADAIGDTSPTQPFPPPPKKGCGIIGMIIMIVVLVVVTIFTAGVATMGLSAAMASSFGGVMAAGAGAIAGGLTLGTAMAVAAVSSVVTQGVGIALGIQDKFDWKQVATSVITAAVGSGLSFLGVGVQTGSKVFDIAANAAIASAATQGVSMAVGLQEKFSWRQVAASAAGAAVSAGAGALAAKAGPAMSNVFGNGVTKLASETFTRFAGGVASASVMGGKIDYASIAADAFGNAVGNSIVDAIQQTYASKQLLSRLATKTGRTIDQITAVIRERRAQQATRSGADKGNLFMMAFDGLPEDILRQMWGSFESGKTFDVAVGDTYGVASFAAGENGGGTITLNSAYAREMERSQRGVFENFAGAELLFGLWEEEGHAADHRARYLSGIGGDSSLDEGALFAYFMAADLVQKGTSGSLTRSVQLTTGSMLTINTDMTSLKAVTVATLNSGRIFRDTGDAASGREFYGPEGHYMTTGLIALPIARQFEPDAGKATQAAATLALWSQMPDLLDWMDARAQWENALAVDAFGFTKEEKRNLRGTYEFLHNIPLIKPANGPEWVENQRAISRKIIIQAMQAGDYAVAGLAIHRLGDSYAHTDANGDPYVIVNGHLGDSFGSFFGETDPDNLFDRPAMARTYAADLANTLARGMNPQVSADYGSTIGLAKWDELFTGSMRTRGSDGNEGRFHDSALAYLKSEQAFGGYAVTRFGASEGPPSYLKSGLMNSSPVDALRRLQTIYGYKSNYMPFFATPMGRFLGNSAHSGAM